MAMVPEVKALLLDALKSGKYEKTTGVLARAKQDGEVIGYCCLGVLSEIASEQGICDKFEQVSDGKGGYETILSIKEQQLDYLGASYEVQATSFLPNSVAAWSGLDDKDQTSLANINDETVGFESVISFLETNF